MRQVRIPGKPGTRTVRAVAALATMLVIAPGVSAAPDMPVAAPAGAAIVSSGDACLDNEEVAFLALINDYRASSGLAPLSVSTTLSAAAAYHSVDMAATGYLDHTMPDGTTVQQNMANFGYEGGTHGENIAAGTTTAIEAMQTWQGSAEHNANMLNSAFGAIGIGRAYDASSQYGWYWTTIFGDVNDMPGWLCGESAPASKSLNLFQTADGARATSDVNLRTGPGPEYDVVTILAPGTEMVVTGRAANAYLPVTVDGKYGWVASEWLEQGVVTQAQTAAPSQPGTATAIDAVEMRSAPADEAGILSTIPAIEVVSLTGQAQDGFLEVTFNGQQGWADAAYLQVADNTASAVQLQGANAPAAAPAPPTTAAPGSQAVATNNVNLRSQPSYSATILSIVPAGTSVSLTGSQANGFFNVRVNGQAGWIDAQYLQ